MRDLRSRSYRGARWTGCAPILVACSLLVACGGGGGGGGGKPPQGQSEDEILLTHLNPNSDLDGDGIPNGRDPDIDGDGLDNATELAYGTSPYSADTDGDGWSDAQEVDLYVASTNYFNPLSADMPRIQLILKSEPQVKMSYTTSSGEAIEYTTSTTEGFADTHGASNSFTSSASTEYGWSVEASFEYQFGLDGGATLGATVGAHGSYTNEDGHEWGTEDSATHSWEAQKARSQSSSSDLTRTGGSITYAVAFRNDGPVGYRIDSMALAAYRIDRNAAGLVQLIGALTQEGEGFSPFTLAPGEESGVFSFRNAALTVDQVLTLLQDSSGIVVGVSGFSVSMEGKTFTEAATSVAAKTARLTIDYGPSIDAPSEQYLIASKATVNEAATTLADLYQPVSLRQALAMVHVPVQTEGAGDHDGLTAVRDEATGADGNRHWYVRHEYSTPAGARRMVVYADSTFDCAYRIDDVLIRTGDVVELIYSIDQDGDGLPLRVEELLGTSDRVADTDGDGLTDSRELSQDGPHTNPANNDTDGDGLNDKEDPAPLVAERSPDATLQSLSFSGVTYAPAFAAGTLAYQAAASLAGDAITVTAVPTRGALRILVRVNGGTPVQVQPGVASDPILLPLGVDTVAVEVTALDGVSKQTYTLAVTSTLAVVGNVRAVYTSPTTVGLAWDPPADRRVSGALILRTTSTGDPRQVQPGTIAYPVGHEWGATTVVAVVDKGVDEAVDEDEAGSLHFESTPYVYAVLPYAKVGSTYVYGEAARLNLATMTPAPNKEPTGTVSVRLCYLLDRKYAKERYEWEIAAALDGGTARPVSTSRSTVFQPTTPYYWFTDDGLHLNPPADCRDVVLGAIPRSGEHTLTITKRIRKSRSWPDDDEVIDKATLTYHYSPALDEWTGPDGHASGAGIAVGYHRDGVASYVYKASSGWIELNLGLKWW